MAWVFTKARRITKRRHDEDAQEILDRLAAYLHDNESEPVEMLCGFWRDQQDAITYQEMRELVLQGYVDEVAARLWQQDYSELAKNQMPRIWGGAMVQGAANTPLLSSLANFTFNMNTPGVLRWIQSRGAEMVTVSTQRQKDAIALLLEDKMRNAHTVDELARLIRPCVGLYRQQAAAVTNYYKHMVKTLTEQHPRTRPERIQLKALEQSTKYAERLHRQRALMIAQTEMAFAYNYGADEGIRQAQEYFLIGRCEKVWCTSGDAQVCEKCAALDGKRIGMEERFYDGNTRYEESGLYPPLHPRCACAVQYVEIEPPPVRRLEQEPSRVEQPSNQNTDNFEHNSFKQDLTFSTETANMPSTETAAHYVTQRPDFSNAIFAGKRNLDWHWEKHQREFPGWTKEQYLQRARDLLMMDLADGVLEELVRSDGSISRYYFPDNEFVATTPDNEIRTFFRPTKTTYWEVEHERN